jgi:hypothetical protein
MYSFDGLIVEIIHTALLERCRVAHAKKDAHLDK